MALTQIARVFAALALAFGLVGSAGAGAGAAGSPTTVPAMAPMAPNQVIIQFRPGTTAAQHAAARATVGAASVERLRAATRTTGRLELAKLTAGVGTLAAIRTLQAQSVVKFAEPNWIYKHSATSNDPYYTNGYLWGMYGDTTSPRNVYGSQAGEAWAAGNTGSKSVYVGIIDEGIDYNHPDLAANIWSNPYDLADGRDNDGNGYVDDVRGWDFVSNNNSIYDPKNSTDKTTDSHGTHVSGTIGGLGGNGRGVVGVSWNVTLISGKFLGSNGGSTAGAIKAVDYFTDLKRRHGLNIVATNNSWGGGGYSQALYDAIERANAQNILFIAAAGNGGTDGRGDNNDTVANYPSNYGNANVIAVASITNTGALSSFSNYGKTQVDLGAPGSNINSTLPKGTYGSLSGTSMATPHVTGAAALYKSTHATATAAQIKSALLNSAVPTTSLNGKTVTGGRLDANGAMSR